MERAFFETLISNLELGIWILDEKDNFIFFNNAIEEISGINADSVIGKCFFDTIPKETIEGAGDFLGFFNEAKSSRKSVRYNSLPIQTPDGRLSYQSGTLVPFYDQIGNYHGIACTILEVNEFRQTLIALNEIQNNLEDRINERTHALNIEKSKLSTYIDLANFIILVLDRNANIELINTKGAEILGYNREDLIGKNWFKTAISEETQNEIYNVFISFMNENRISSHYRNEIIDSQGQIHTIDWNNAGIYEDGILVSVVASGEDVTYREKMEDALHRKEKLDTLGLFAGGIAHDYNNILTTILGNIDLALISSTDLDVQNLLADSKIGIERAKELTQQLLIFSKGGNPLKKIIDIRPLIIETTQFALSGSNISYQFQLVSDLWNVNVDSNQIGQVLTNIIINAKQSMTEHGSIQISADNVKIKSDPILSPGDYIKIEIQDEGSGISGEDLPHVFDPFFSTKSQGTGLGLPVTYSIVNKHNGTIRIESNVGIGTTFTILLPASHDKAESPMHTDLIEKQNNYRVLIMDDDLSVSQTLGKMLKSLGHDVVFCANGEQTLKYYESHMNSDESIDFVIMDLTIRGHPLGGKETIVLLKSIDQNAIAIVSSGYSNDEILSSYENYGFTACLKKPYTLQDIQEVIHLLEFKNRSSS